MKFDAGRFGIGRRMGKLATAVMVAALGVATVWAQGAGGGGPGMGPHRPPMERAMGPGGDHGRWWNNPKAIDKFKLTDVQRKAMDDIYQQHRLTIVDLHATLEKAEIAMEPMMRADQPDETRILAQIDRVAQARAELEKANARMLLGIRKQLTPDQWKQLEAARASRRDGDGRDGRDGRGRWEGHGDGHGQGQGGPDRQWHKPGGPGQTPPPPGGPGGSGPSAEGPGLPGDGAPGSEQ
jgi:periplasmic protein CpxP/Spy